MKNNPGPSDSTLGKRKKKMPTNANPLFTQWLQEWKDEANEKGWKSANTFGKALKTLKLFPLPLESGKDCKLLQNFGDKICKMLDEKLAQWKLNGGALPHNPEAAPSCHGAVSASSSTSTVLGQAPSIPVGSSLPARQRSKTLTGSNVPRSSPTKRKDPSVASAAYSANSRAHSKHTISDDSGSDTEVRPPSQKASRRDSSNNRREYVPAYRSGPYALIIALYRTMQNPGYRGFMLKAELCEVAQSMADKSFTMPDPGSHYTAWSSMGTLIKKGLIIKYSNPAKFFLTEKGVELAERLEEAEDQNADSVLTSSITRKHSGNVLTGETSSKKTHHQSSKSNSQVVEGQSLHTGDDLEAALNTSLLEDCYQVHERAGDTSAEEADLSLALNLSLDSNSAAAHRGIGNKDISIEDTDLEAALKASLEMSNSQDTSPEGNCGDVSKSSIPHEKLVDDISMDDTDLDAALKASLATSLAPASSPVEPVKPNHSSQGASCVDVDSRSSPLPLPNLSPRSRANSEESEEDQDMKRAIAESLLSYSQELSLSQCSPSEAREKSHKAGNSDSLSCTDQLDQSVSTTAATKVEANVTTDDSVLIVSDEENDIVIPWKEEVSTTSPPPRSFRKLHTLSPSPSPPPCSLASLSKPSMKDTTIATAAIPKPPRLQLSPLKTFTSLVDKHPAPAFKSPSVSRNVLLSSSLSQTGNDRDEKEMVIVPDVDHNDDDNNNTSKRSKIRSKPWEDSEDELPDLDVPLFQRLLNNENIRSDFLQDFSSNRKHQSSSDCLTVLTSSSVNTHPRESEPVILTSSSSNSDGGSKQTQSHANTKTASVSFHKDNCLSQQPSKLCDTNSTSLKGVQASSLTIPCRKLVSTGSSSEDSLQPKQPSMLSTSSAGSSLSSLPPTSSQSTPVPNCPPEFTLQPGTFDIVLCLDNREFYGSKSNSKTLLPDLMKSGVTCDLRLLHVGDLLWVAREKTGPNIDRVHGRELVLDYIVERKRMDDLVSSLTDGRMKEQKFRMKHCGLSETIILIEEYGSIQNFSLSEDRIKQSIVNSQVIDGFKVKRCGSTKDAVSYLAIMTRFLQQHLSSKTLHAVPVEHIRLLKGQQNLQSRELYLPPFTAFNEAAVKHKDLTVTELFAKQLIQVPGVSVERARAITNVYPMLSSLLDAYRKCNGEKESEKLLASIKYGKNDRNLGIAVSRTLYMLYTQQQGLS